jgi:ElaB/YqjD/DUF883 family membrane-anchored ribosome-binding protein
MAAGYPTGTAGSAEEHKGVKESAREMASHLGESVGQAKDKARDFVSGVAGRAEETWRSAREGLREGYSNVSDRAGDVWADATGFVRRYPIASLAVAFGVGCLVGCAFMAVSHTDDRAERLTCGS